MYKLQIAPINENADGKYFNNWLRENYTFTSISYLELTVEVFFATEPTAIIKTEIADKYHSLTSSDTLPYCEILQRLSKGRIDGDEYFYNFAAKNFGLPHATGALTTENVNYCFNRLKPVIDRLEYGFWEISLYCMENEIAPVTQTDIDNGYTQALHDEIIADINAYLGN